MLDIAVGQLWRGMRRLHAGRVVRVVEILSKGHRALLHTVRDDRGPLVYPDRRASRITKRVLMADYYLLESRKWIPFYVDLGFAVPWNIARELERKAGRQGSRGRFIHCVEDLQDYVQDLGVAHHRRFLDARALPDAPHDRMVFYLWPKDKEAVSGMKLREWSNMYDVPLDWKNIDYGVAR